MLWLAPVLVVVVGAVPLVMACLRASEESKRLMWELRKLGTIRMDLARVQASGLALSASVRDALGRRRGAI